MLTKKEGGEGKGEKKERLGWLVQAGRSEAREEEREREGGHRLT